VEPARFSFVRRNQTKPHHTMNETEILKYALTFLLSNMDENVMEDIADYIGESSQEEVESTLQEMIDTII
jgi:hypothetical protein